MLLHSLKALCKAPGGAGSIWENLEAVVSATRVSGRVAYGFRTELHCADVVPCRLNEMGFNILDLCSNLVLVQACIIQCGPLLQHTSLKISLVRASNATDKMLIYCIAVFQYISNICRCGASANGFATHCIPQLTITKSLALRNGRQFHMWSSTICPLQIHNASCLSEKIDE